jgi:hypothetical protein
MNEIEIEDEKRIAGRKAKDDRQFQSALKYYEKQFDKCQHIEAREMALDDVGCRFGKEVKIAIRKVTEPETTKAEVL